MNATPIYDPRAQRRVAAAMAEEHRANAEERHAEAEERRAAATTARETARAQTRMQWQAQAAQLASEVADRDQARRIERRRASRAMRDERATARRARWAARAATLRTGVPRAALDVLWASVIVAPLVLTWNVQAAYAETDLGIPAGMSWLFPLAIETGAWACAFETRRRARAGLPAGQLPLWMWVLAGVAATINLSHGLSARGIAAGLALGALSVLGVALHYVRSSLDAAATGADPATVRERARHLRARLVRQVLRWVWHPVLSLRAVSLTARAGIGMEVAWSAAHRDRYGVDPDATRHDRRVGAVITRRATRADRMAARNDAFVIVSGQILALPSLLDTPADPGEAATAGQSETTPGAEPDRDLDTDPIPYQLAAEAYEHGLLDEHGMSRHWDTAPAVRDRASELIAAGVGRRRLSRELEITEYEARQLLARTRNHHDEQREPVPDSPTATGDPS